MDIVNLGIIAYFLGIFLSFGLPYLYAYLNDGESFEIKKIISEVIGGIFMGLVIIVAPGFVERLTEIAAVYDYVALYFISIMLMAMGGGFAGGMAEKLGRAGYNKVTE